MKQPSKKLIELWRKQAEQSDHNGIQAQKQLEAIGVDLDEITESESTIHYTGIGTISKFAADIHAKTARSELAKDERFKEKPRQVERVEPDFTSIFKGKKR